MSLLAIGDFYTRVNIWTLSQEMVTAKKKKQKAMEIYYHVTVIHN